MKPGECSLWRDPVGRDMYYVQLSFSSSNCASCGQVAILVVDMKGSRRTHPLGVVYTC